MQMSVLFLAVRQQGLNSDRVLKTNRQVSRFRSGISRVRLPVMTLFSLTFYNSHSKEKMAGLEVEPVYPTSKPGNLTVFRGLSEFGLYRRTARTVHAHLQPLARHGNASVNSETLLCSEKISQKQRYFNV